MVIQGNGKLLKLLTVEFTWFGGLEDWGWSCRGYKIDWHSFSIRVSFIDIKIMYMWLKLLF